MKYRISITTDMPAAIPLLYVFALLGISSKIAVLEYIPTKQKRLVSYETQIFAGDSDNHSFDADSSDVLVWRGGFWGDCCCAS